MRGIGSSEVQLPAPDVTDINTNVHKLTIRLQLLTNECISNTKENF